MRARKAKTYSSAENRLVNAKISPKQKLIEDSKPHTHTHNHNAHTFQNLYQIVCLEHFILIKNGKKTLE